MALRLKPDIGGPNCRGRLHGRLNKPIYTGDDMPENPPLEKSARAPSRRSSRSWPTQPPRRRDRCRRYANAPRLDVVVLQAALRQGPRRAAPGPRTCSSARQSHRATGRDAWTASGNAWRRYCRPGLAHGPRPAILRSVPRPAASLDAVHGDNAFFAATARSSRRSGRRPGRRRRRRGRGSSPPRRECRRAPGFPSRRSPCWPCGGSRCSFRGQIWKSFTQSQRPVDDAARRQLG